MPHYSTSPVAGTNSGSYLPWANAVSSNTPVTSRSPSIMIHSPYAICDPTLNIFTPSRISGASRLVGWIFLRSFRRWKNTLGRFWGRCNPWNSNFQGEITNFRLSVPEPPGSEDRRCSRPPQLHAQWGLSLQCQGFPTSRRYSRPSTGYGHGTWG